MANRDANGRTNGYRKPALILGAAALAACLVGAVFFPSTILRSYLVGYMFWLGISVGSLGVLMIHHAARGGWGLILRRILESSVRTLPLLAVLFLPILVGAFASAAWSESFWLYPWTHEDVKARYLNLPFFTARAIFYFAVWIGLGLVLTGYFRRQDGHNGTARAISGPGLVLWVLTVTFSSVDWLMSLDPHWYSSIFPVTIGAAQVLSAFAFAILSLVWLSHEPELAGLVSARYLRDMGNLLLAFVMFWAYTSFSQFLLIWMGNLPEETVWYEDRFAGGWKWIAGALLVFQFVLPFLLLLYGRNKRQMGNLKRIALLILAISLVNYFWHVAPSFPPHYLSAHLVDVLVSLLAWAGIGGLWFATFLGQLQAAPLVPEYDPLLEEVRAHG